IRRAGAREFRRTSDAQRIRLVRRQIIPGRGMNEYAWLIRREFWENRAIWIVPAAIGAALTLAALFGNVQVPGLSVPDAHVFSGVVLFGFGAAFFVVMNIYATWYLLDCLYAERKDRSVLFWKSLPISDTATVLAKLFT